MKLQLARLIALLLPVITVGALVSSTADAAVVVVNRVTSASKTVTSPTTPAGVTAAADSATQVTIRWSASSGASWYRLYRNGNFYATGITNTTYVDAGLQPGTTYSYFLTACSGTGRAVCSGLSKTVTVTTPTVTTPPSTLLPPSGVTAVADTTSQVTVRWTAASGTSWYRLYRNGDFYATGITTASYVDTGLQSGSTYSYFLTSCTGTGVAVCSVVSATATVTTPTVTTTIAPPMPTGLTAVANSASQVTVNWVGSSGASYRLYRNGTMHVSDLTTPTYLDSGLSPSSSYSYSVAACVTSATGAALCSGTSNVVAATTPAATSLCSGVAVGPTQFTQALIDAYPQATTFCLSSGTFNLSSALAPKSYDSIIGTGAGTVLEGQNITDTAILGFCCSLQTNVTISNLVVQGFTGSTGRGAIKAGGNWTISNVESRFNRFGIELNTGVTLQNSYLHDNTQYGLFGAGDGTRVISNEVAHNNTGNYDKGNAGAMKFCCRSTQNIVIQNNNFHDNIGNGIWCDGCGANIVVTGNTSTNNTDSGIILEIAISGKISNNTVTDNGSAVAGKSCWYGAGIHINTSPNIEVYGNTVTASNGTNGICAIDYSRSDAYGPLTNFFVHDNTVKLRSAGNNGIVGNAAAFASAANNRFVNNTYYATSVTEAHWSWLTNPITWSTWQAGGQDATGRLYTW